MSNENIAKGKSITVTLRDGCEYNIKPLTINELIDIWPLITKLENAKEDVSVELLEDMKELVYRALKKQVEKDKVGDLVDLVDLKTIISAVVGQAS